MSQEYLNSPCPICDENYIKNADPNGLMSEIDCARCGKYKIGRGLLDAKPWPKYVGHDFFDSYYLLSAVFFSAYRRF